MDEPEQDDPGGDDVGVLIPGDLREELDVHNLGNADATRRDWNCREIVVLTAVEPTHADIPRRSPMPGISEAYEAPSGT